MTSDQQGFLEKSRRSIDAAKELLKGDFPEFAVSRAYYAMFYCAEALLLSQKLTFSSHSAVISAFGREFAKTSLLPQHLHRFLKNAEDMRTDGDYALAADISRENAIEQVTHAEEFLAETQRYFSSLH
ncbi:MAG: HEPN domain-containing protein [Chthoniobacteraceae bacterium]|nr:HEPN domain-containing protein [Chthoniobacteraceae bacterium]